MKKPAPKAKDKTPAKKPNPFQKMALAAKKRLKGC